MDKELYAATRLKFEWKSDTTRKEIINKLAKFGLSRLKLRMSSKA